jgi:hypothetical protein
VTPRRVLSELESLAARLGVSVRAEAFSKGVLEGRGGLCWVDGKALVVMDEKLPVPDRIAVLAGALAQLNLDTSQVPLFLLQTIESTRRRARPRRARKPARGKPAGHPGLARARPRKVK